MDRVELARRYGFQYQRATEITDSLIKAIKNKEGRNE